MSFRRVCVRESNAHKSTQEFEVTLVLTQEPKNLQPKSEVKRMRLFIWYFKHLPTTNNYAPKT